MRALRRAGPPRTERTSKAGEGEVLEMSEGGDSHITMGSQDHLKDRDFRVRTGDAWTPLKREGEGGRVGGAPGLCG